MAYTFLICLLCTALYKCVSINRLNDWLTDRMIDRSIARRIHWFIDLGLFYWQIVETIVKIKLPEDLHDVLRDGVILCHLANHLRPHSVASVHVPSPTVVMTCDYCVMWKPIKWYCFILDNTENWCVSLNLTTLLNCTLVIMPCSAGYICLFLCI